MCCKATSDFPNLCLIGPCGCSPENSHQVKVCDCGPNKCFDGNECVAVEIGEKPYDETAIKFISPKDGDKWIIGRDNIVELNQGSPYESHCSNVFMLVDVEGFGAGVISMIDKDQSSVIWNTKDVYDIACGTGATIHEIEPGMYRIRFRASDTRAGEGPYIEVESELFEIVTD